MKGFRLRGVGAHGIALALLLVLIAELTLSVHRQSLSWDEGDHIFAGYQSWKEADFGYNPEHPPFVKELATLPLLAMHLKTPPSKHLPFFKDEAYFDGRDFIFDNGGLSTANKIIFRARMFAASLTILLAVLVYLAALEMFGAGAALFGLALLVFEPNIIANGAYVTTDMGVTCFLFATLYALYRFRERPGWKRLLVLGVATGLALASKHSAVLLLPIGLVMAGFELALPGRHEQRRAVARQYVAAFAGALAVGLTILWATYGFRFSAHPHGGHMTPSLMQYMQPLHGPGPYVYGFLARHHLLPESYLYGLVDIRRLSVPGSSFPTYLFGKVHAHGVPYYFPAAFVIKSTIGFMLLLVIAVFAIATRKLDGRRRLAFLVIPPAVYLLIALGTGLNIGARHILPMYPFLIVLCAGAAVAMARVHRAWMYAVVALLGWHIVSTTRSYPNYIAYSNELWGGPSQTYKYLTDSNVDWGQQLKTVKAYLDRNGITNCWFGYFVTPEIDFHAYGIPCHALPTADSIWAHQQVDAPRSISGTVLVSAGTLTGYEFGSVVLSPYQPFMHARPVALLDDGVFVFQGTFDTSFASALGHATRADASLKQHDYPAALDEAREAVATDAGVLQAQMVLGDTLAAMHQPAASAAAYGHALALAHTMEPSAQADWVPLIKGKIKGLEG